MEDAGDAPQREGSSSSPEAETIRREGQPMVEYALDQALTLKRDLDQATRSAVHAAADRLSQIGSTASAHSLYTLELIRSYLSQADELAFAKLKEGVLVVGNHPAATCGIVAGLGILGFKRPRNFLFRYSRRLFISDESLLSSAEAKTKSLKEMVASLKHEGKKLEERASMAEADFLSGRTRLRQTGNQIQGLINSVYKVEKQIRGLKDILGELPRKDASVFRPKVSSLASEARKEKRILDKAVSRITGYGISI